MENFQYFFGSTAVALLKKEFASSPRLRLGHRRCALGQHSCRPHRPEVADQRIEVLIAEPDTVNVDHRHVEACSNQQLGKAGGFDPGMGAGDDAALTTACLNQTCSQRGQAVAASDGADQRRIGAQRTADQSKREREVVDGVERPDCDAKIIFFAAIVEPVFLHLCPAGEAREEQTGISHVDVSGNGFEA